MRQAVVCAVAVLAVASTTSAAVCDVCGLRNPHSKDYSTPIPQEVVPACQNYKEAACCSDTTIQKIAAGYGVYDDADSLYDVAACDKDTSLPKKMSEECKAFFQAEYCFYECDVNASKYRKHEDCIDSSAALQDQQNGWQIYNMPIKASYCDAWYEACKDDYFCVDFAGGDFSYFAHSSINKLGGCTYDGGAGNCRTFASLFGGKARPAGEAMCEDLWGESFLYDTSNEGYVMNWEAGQANPNDAAHVAVPVPDPCPDHAVTEQGREAVCGATPGFPALAVKPCEVCHLRNDFTLDIAKPVELSGVCGKYRDNACCSAETATNVDQETNLYDPKYTWEKCYANHASLNQTLNANATLQAAFDRCNRWFKAEECFYECDVNAGKWRKHADCTDDAGSNAWQIEGMPIRASECDAFYNDCKDMILCTCSGPDCADGMAPKSLFGVSSDVCSQDMTFCQKTVGEVWAGGKDWCETLWDQSFKYEEHEAKAYTFAWNDELAVDGYTHKSNPNNELFTDKPFPPNCPTLDATADMCLTDGSLAPTGAEATPAGAAPSQVATPMAAAASPATALGVLAGLGLAALAL